MLITGSNRGIGLEFARQYAARGWTVIATTRRPDEATELRKLAAGRPNVVIERLDITSDAEVAALAAKYRGRPIDLLINNAALLEKPDSQLLGKLDYELFDRSFAINATGPMRVTEALLENVAASGQKKIVTLGSAAGSNGLLNPPVNYYPYRASKAALNLLMHNLALDVAKRGILVGIINPGPGGHPRRAAAEARRGAAGGVRRADAADPRGQDQADHAGGISHRHGQADRRADAGPVGHLPELRRPDPALVGAP